MIFCCKIFSGDTKLTQTNFCPEIGLSSSKRSIYLGLSDPSGNCFFSNAIADIIIYYNQNYLSFYLLFYYFFLIIYYKMALGKLGEMIDLGELLRRIVKYLVEGIMVAIAAYAIPKKSLNLDEVLLIALTAAATFSILDTYVPSMAVSARSGAGFGIGANLVGFPRL